LGLEALKKELAQRIAWEQMPIRCRLHLWQAAHDAITSARDHGAVLICVAELKERLTGADFEDQDFTDALKSLVEQGLVVRVDGFGGEDILILGVDHIDRYAGCIVRAAKNNPRQIAAIDEASLSNPAIYEEVPKNQRIKAVEVRTAVIEAVKHLLTDKSLAFRSHGLLILPSEYPLERPLGAGDLPQTLPLHFRFEGAGSDVYASTVCMLERCERFGPVRLWRKWAQFERVADVCALHFKPRLGNLWVMASVSEPSR
jgi:hypothetical protein